MIDDNFILPNGSEPITPGLIFNNPPLQQGQNTWMILPKGIKRMNVRKLLEIASYFNHLAKNGNGLAKNGNGLRPHLN